MVGWNDEKTVVRTYCWIVPLNDVRCVMQGRIRITERARRTGSASRWRWACLRPRRWSTCTRSWGGTRRAGATPATATWAAGPTRASCYSTPALPSGRERPTHTRQANWMYIFCQGCGSAFIFCGSGSSLFSQCGSGSSCFSQCWSGSSFTKLLCDF